MAFTCLLVVIAAQKGELNAPKHAESSSIGAVEEDAPVPVRHAPKRVVGRVLKRVRNQEPRRIVSEEPKPVESEPPKPVESEQPKPVVNNEPKHVESVKPKQAVAEEPKRDLSAHKPNKDAVIKSSSNTVEDDGSYQYQFESSNGISANEAGVAGQVVQGSTTWIARSGEPLAISYIADKDGYRAMGFHLPTPPPIPLAIQRALKYLEEHAPKEPQEHEKIQDRHCCQ